jgi:uncharacterized protein YkwD
MLLTLLALLLAVLVNDARFRAGVPPLVTDVPLSVAAADHALWMAQADTFSHTGADRSMPWDRAAAAGYGSQDVGEAMARSSHDSVATVADALLASPPHAAILLDARYRTMGVAVARAADGRLYWVIDVGGGQ